MPDRINRNLRQRSRQAIYAIKREYGAMIDIHKLISATTDERTGVKSIESQVFRIRRAAILPARVFSHIKQSISLISANKQMVMGGTYDQGTRHFLVDRNDCRDLPSLTTTDWIVFNDRKYQIEEIVDIEFDSGWIIEGKQLVGEVPRHLFRPVITESLSVGHSAEATVE